MIIIEEIEKEQNVRQAAATLMTHSNEWQCQCVAAASRFSLVLFWL